MKNIILVLSLFHLVYCKTLHDVGARSERKAMRQQMMKGGRKFRVIPIKTTFIHKDNDKKNHEEAILYCNNLGATLPTVISTEQKVDFQTDTNQIHWLAAKRNYTKYEFDPWKWPGDELMEETYISDQFDKDDHHDCLTLTSTSSGSKYKDQDCGSHAPANICAGCELPYWRRYYLEKDGNSEVKVMNTFTIVKDLNVDYDKAVVGCNDLGGDAKLAEFFTNRELEKIDAEFEDPNGEDTYFLGENVTEWRFWIGAKATRGHGQRRQYNSGDLVLPLRDFERRKGHCLMYHITRSEEGKVVSTFAWAECKRNQNRFSIEGYICKMHLNLIR